MRAVESWILVYLLNSLWQVPLVFCAALAAARLARPAGPRMEHRVWAGALLLESGLPLCHFHVSEWLRRAWEMLPLPHKSGAAGGEIQIFMTAGTTHGIAWLPASVQGLIVALYLCGLLYFAVRLGWGVWSTSNLLRRTEEVALTDETARKLEFCGRIFGIDRDRVRVAQSQQIPGPATVGIRRHTLLLPAGFPEQVRAEDMDAVLAHEFAHIERQDFAKNLLYGILSLPVAYHPLLPLTRAQLADTRELVCDAMAVAALPGRERYARSLLRMASLLADRATPRLLHAIGIFDANIFERRVMNLTRNTGTVGTTRRLLAVASCGLIALATCISAMALQTDEPAPSSQAPAPRLVNISPSAMARNLLTHVMPVYPPDAKAAKVQGTVVLQAVIGKDGHVKTLHIVSGPAMLQQAAEEAVNHWVYKPYLLNGAPVEVTTRINVIFTLADKTTGDKPAKN